MKRILVLVMILILPVLLLKDVYAKTTSNDLVYLTEEYPPYNFAKVTLSEERTTATGISVDVLGAMFKEMGSSKTVADIKIVPWSNAYLKAQDVAGTVLFSTQYNEQRKNMFKWVGPIIGGQNAIIGLKSRGIKIKTPKDFSKYTIGVVREDAATQLIVDLGVLESDLVMVAKPEHILREIIRGDVDLVVYNPDVFKWVAKMNRVDPSMLEVAYPLANSKLYYAFHKSTPDSLIEEFQAALDKIKAKKKGEGSTVYQEILDNYLK